METYSELLEQGFLDKEDYIENLERVLQAIVDWKLPKTGKFWDEEKTRPMSYGACYGSNGERDYFRELARKALM